MQLMNLKYIWSRKIRVTEKEEVKLTVSLFFERKLLCFLVVSQAFDCSIGKDEHLAVAFFQRGMTFYRKQRQVVYSSKNT